MSNLISRQQAIEALKICDNNEDGISCYKCPLRDERWDGAWQDDETSCYRKLMRDSAELLSAQPNLQPTCNQLAIDAISRQQAIEALRMDISIIPFAKAREYVREAIETIYNRLEELPSVQ